jgi:hypothetical protein
MTNPQTLREDLDRAIDAIEGGYEFLLAYAAQGRRTDRGGPGGQGPREKLQAMVEALDRLPALAKALAESSHAEAASGFGAFFEVLDRDAAVSIAAIRLVLSMPDISSQLVDNLNASIHLRAVLTDIFLLDEAFKS